MATARPSGSQEIRSRLRHPVIDSDGHILEIQPVLLDYIRDVGGESMVRRLRDRTRFAQWFKMTPEERRRSAGWVPPWWVPTAHTLDYATGAFPKLLHQRMDEIGLDFTVLYPTTALNWVRIPEDAELRQGVCRAVNRYYADVCREYADRMTPAALVPMDSPREAIAELEHVVNVLGLKAILISGYAHRPAPWVDREKAPIDGYGDRLDLLALDSDHDYDPFWARCVELGAAPTTHTGSQGWGFRRTSNYMFNHIGHFAASSEALAKALFVGGVTRRFPQLRVGFLECGVWWACALYADLIARWRKRGGGAVRRLDPANLDVEEILRLAGDFAPVAAKGREEDLRRAFGRGMPHPEALDDFAACGVQRPEDIRDRFIPNFYFGCEADDPMNAWAFNTKVNPLGARLRAIFSSDISHWDVPDMREPVEEAWELVEHGLITEEDFRDFVFGNPVRLYAGMNRDFFKGTRVEADAAALLASEA